MPHNRMSAVKRAVLLLMLAALGTEAAPGPDCDGLNRTLGKDDLHAVSLLPVHTG